MAAVDRFHRRRYATDVLSTDSAATPARNSFFMFNPPLIPNLSSHAQGEMDFLGEPVGVEDGNFKFVHANVS